MYPNRFEVAAAGRSCEPLVWIINSAYTGELNARIGVAQRLGFRFEVIPLPDGTATAFVGAVRRRYDSIRSASPAHPLIVLSGTGEDTVCEIADLRTVFGTSLTNVYLASILPDVIHPRLTEYDLIASPQIAGANVITTLGVPHRITTESLQQACGAHEGLFGSLPRPLIGLLLGGNTRYCSGFDAEYGMALAERVANTARSIDGYVVVANSRRTPACALTAVRDALGEHCCHVCDWQTSPSDLYRAVLGHCDVLIVSGDSLSMCSEASFTGKPVLVDLADQATESYHREIIGRLVSGGVARPLGDRFEPWTYVPPDPTGDVATAIRERLSQRVLPTGSGRSAKTARNP